MSAIIRSLEKKSPSWRTNTVALQRKCDKCRKKRQLLQRRSAVQEDPSAVPPIVHDVLNYQGQPLDSETRSFFELRFGHDFGKMRVHSIAPQRSPSDLIIGPADDSYEKEADHVADMIMKSPHTCEIKGIESGYDFSRVRLHLDGSAAKSAHAIGARAFTVGQDIVFGSGEYDPGTSAGKRLIAHELVHFIQQSGGEPSASIQRDGDPDAGAVDDASIPGGVGAPVDSDDTDDSSEPVIDLGLVDEWPEVMFSRSRPPAISQGTGGFFCWAAAGASWLQATGIQPGATRESIIDRFSDCLCEDGSMLEQDLSDIFGELGAEIKGAESFDYNFVRKELTNGHILMFNPGGIGHAVVGYEVGVDPQGKPNMDYFSVYDPGGGYKHISFSQGLKPVYIGVKKGPGPRARCHGRDNSRECNDAMP